MKKLAILGPGLLGGSLALAVRKLLPECRIAVWGRRPTAVEEVRDAGIADIASTELAPVVEGADLVVFCVPIGAMPTLARQIVPLIVPEALITDVGSVKGPVVEAMVPIFEKAGRGKFVGSHPMAGSEQAGLTAARADLFHGAACILTPHHGLCPDALNAVAEFWKLLGCITRTLSPEEHDRTVALVSHLPHLLASALVDFVCAESPDSVNFCGNGFRDTTRVASGPPEMWSEIFAFNRAALHAHLETLIGRLQDVSRDLAAGNDLKMKELLTNAKVHRDQLKRGN
ncbi:MAG: prephenate dehydrogenase/arogenate dehydrogenase family protein [Verrucomicrobiota bacterium]